MFKKGDKVRFVAANTEHMGLRYEVNPGDVGEVTYVDETGWMFVDWGKFVLNESGRRLDEAAMRMWPEEVELVAELCECGGWKHKCLRYGHLRNVGRDGY